MAIALPTPTSADVDKDMQESGNFTSGRDVVINGCHEAAVPNVSVPQAVVIFATAVNGRLQQYFSKYEVFFFFVRYDAVHPEKHALTVRKCCTRESP